MKTAVCFSALVLVLLVLPCDAWFSRRKPSSTPASALTPGGMKCDDCSCHCTKGNWIQYSTPSTNGCGANQFHVIVGQLSKVIPDGFQSCCHAHDTCYGACGKSKRTCDNEFCSCMSNVCDGKGFWAKPGCWLVKGAFCGGIKSGGCDAYTAAQKNRCRCT